MNPRSPGPSLRRGCASLGLMPKSSNLAPAACPARHGVCPHGARSEDPAGGSPAGCRVSMPGSPAAGRGPHRAVAGGRACRRGGSGGQPVVAVAATAPAFGCVAWPGDVWGQALWPERSFLSEAATATPGLQSSLVFGRRWQGGIQFRETAAESRWTKERLFPCKVMGWPREPRLGAAGEPLCPEAAHL